MAGFKENKATVNLNMFSKHDISRYYDLSEVHYCRIWKLDKNHSLHYGYWEASTKNFHEALLNINRVMADTAGIQPGEKILDAGCGVGGSSIWLAKEKQCTVTGISINERQIIKARARAKKKNISDKVVFEIKDYEQTDFNDHSFDVVWAIESVCYADNKINFLKEAFRILKPGGRIIIADFFKENNLDAENETEIKRWANGWAINDFTTIEKFISDTSIAGFQKIQATDVTHAIMPSAKKLYRSYYFGWAAAKLYQFFHPDATELGKNNFINAKLQYQTLKKGLWKYFIVHAKK